eukprot:595264-Rhodomonas_salina.3
MDPVLVSIINNYNKKPHGAKDCLDGTVGDFTNRIIMSKDDDIRYFLRMIATRLDNEFGLLVSKH